MTNRELMMRAMPLKSLSRKDWNTLSRHIEETTRNGDPAVLAVLEALRMNQSRLEVISNYTDYYGDIMDEQVREESVQVGA